MPAPGTSAAAGGRLQSAHLSRQGAHHSPGPGISRLRTLTFAPLSCTLNVLSPSPIHRHPGAPFGSRSTSTSESENSPEPEIGAATNNIDVDPSPAKDGKAHQRKVGWGVITTLSYEIADGAKLRKLPVRATVSERAASLILCLPSLQTSMRVPEPSTPTTNTTTMTAVLCIDLIADESGMHGCGPSKSGSHRRAYFLFCLLSLHACWPSINL